MLPTPWILSDGSSAEAICRGVLVAAIRGGSAPRDFQDADFAESLGFLLGETFVLIRQFDSGRGNARRLGAYLYDRLRYRLIDYWRSWYGRNGQKRVADLSFHAQAVADAGGDGIFALEDGGDPCGDPLGGAAAGDSPDSPDAGGWLDAEADRRDAGAARDAGGSARSRAAERHRGAGAVVPERVSRASRTPDPYVDCGCGWRSYRQAPNGIDRWHWPKGCLGCGRPLLELLPASEEGSAEALDRAAA